MHSDDIKQEIEGLFEELESLKNISNDNLARLRLEEIRTKAILLDTLAVNELNWTGYYLKEEVKTLNKNILSLQNILSFR